MTYNGISEGSTAIYTTIGRYRVNGGLTFQTTCRNNRWVELPEITEGRASGSTCLNKTYAVYMYMHKYIIIFPNQIRYS